MHEVQKAGSSTSAQVSMEGATCAADVEDQLLEALANHFDQQ